MTCLCWSSPCFVVAVHKSSTLRFYTKRIIVKNVNMCFHFIPNSVKDIAKVVKLVSRNDTIMYKLHNAISYVHHYNMSQYPSLLWTWDMKFNCCRFPSGCMIKHFINYIALSFSFLADAYCMRSKQTLSDVIQINLIQWSLLKDLVITTPICRIDVKVPFLLTWLNFNPSVDRYSHAQ